MSRLLCIVNFSIRIKIFGDLIDLIVIIPYYILYCTSLFSLCKFHVDTFFYYFVLLDNW